MIAPSLFLLLTLQYFFTRASCAQIRAAVQDRAGFQQGDGETSDGDVLTALFNSYDPAKMPIVRNSGQPVRVFVTAYLRRLDAAELNEDKFDVQLTFRQNWQDPRLNYASSVNQPTFVSVPAGHAIWKPDTFFQNELSAVRHNIDVDNYFIHVYSNGTVLYSTRLSLVLFCRPNFRQFPFDQPTCSLNFSSYGHTNQSIKYSWKSPEPFKVKDVVGGKVPPEFVLIRVEVAKCISRTLIGTYSCLSMNFLLKREISAYAWQFFLPLLLLVAASWVPFWLNQQSVLPKLLLGVFCTSLCVVVMSRRPISSAPSTPYLKASDIFGLTSAAFCFLALIESAIVSSRSNSDKLKRLITIWQRDGRSATTIDGKSHMVKSPVASRMPSLDSEEKQMSAGHIDVLSRIGFPAAFIIFLIVFFAWILLF